LNGTAILYADRETKSIKQAVSEIERRRKKQTAYNKMHHVTPASIQKPFRQSLVFHQKEQESIFKTIEKTDTMTPHDKRIFIKKLQTEMHRASKNLEFELALEIRDMIAKLKKS